MKILLTGSTGFVGQKLVSHLLERTNAILQLAVRGDDFSTNKINMDQQRIIIKNVGNISAATNWSNALVECDVIIHAAARVHILKEDVDDPLMAFREVNVEGTLNLARQAIEAGVKRFIYISSIKVNGEYTLRGVPFTPDDLPMPVDHYAVSKFEAEQGLIQLTKESNMEVVIIRPPLIYGPGVKGNFLRMLQLMQKKIPFPLGALQNNKRSLVSLENLVDLIRICIFHPNAANQIFLVSDDDDIATTALLKKIRNYLGNRTPLLTIPSKILRGVAVLLGRKSEIMRLYGSLQVDISKSREQLDWRPIMSVDESLYQTVRDYMELSNERKNHE